MSHSRETLSLGSADESTAEAEATSAWHSIGPIVPSFASALARWQACAQCGSGSSYQQKGRGTSSGAAGESAALLGVPEDTVLRARCMSQLTGPAASPVRARSCDLVATRF